MTNIGRIEIQDLFVGSANAVGLYQGSVVIWEKSEPQWLCFTANTTNSTIRLDKAGFSGADPISLETSTDGTTWTDYGWTDKTGDTLTMTNIGDKVYMRAKNENTTIGSGFARYYTFVGTGSFAASGNIQSLLKADCSRTDAPTYCYALLFNDCSSLTDAPELPATTLADNCYNSMFNGCSNLSSITVGFSDWPASSSPTYNWVNGVAASGTFTCPSGLSDLRGANCIPTGWTKTDA